MAGLWVNNNKTFSGGIRVKENGNEGVPPEKVWWPPVFLFFVTSLMCEGSELILLYESSNNRMIWISTHKYFFPSFSASDPAGKASN